jgi:SAM-dependent methyltransferase
MNIEMNKSKINFVCTVCRNELVKITDGYKCLNCDKLIMLNKHGYLDFNSDSVTDFDSTTDEYAQLQITSGTRVYETFLRPLFDKELFVKVLDVGCGLGMGIQNLIQDGFDAYGLDMSNLAPFWNKLQLDNNRFICCDSSQIPFESNSFDITYSLGVIEHIGTVNGNCTLRNNYREIRKKYASEILRVTKKGGRIIVACPNKAFPIDIQHGAFDGVGTAKVITRMRDFFFRKTGIHIHPTWGENHLLSYREIRNLFSENTTNTIEALSLKNYFGFSQLERGILKPFVGLVTHCVENIPEKLLETCLNPYVLVQIKKS